MILWEPKQKLQFLIKVTFFTIFFSVLWGILFPHTPQITYKGDHMHEDQGRIWRIDRVRQREGVSPAHIDQQIEERIEALLAQPTTHSVAEDDATSLYEQVCTVYADICKKVYWQGQFSAQEKFTYQLLVVYLIKQIDERLESSSNLRETIEYITMYRDDVDRRGSAGHRYVKMNVGKISHAREFWEVLTHEFGHIIDLGVILGNAQQKDADFTEFGNIEWSIDDPSLTFYEISRENENVRKDQASYKDFVSGYAMKGIYEEFAETKNLWFNHNDIFFQLAQTNPILARKYNFFDQLYQGKFFREDPDNMSKFEQDSRPWDTTKLY